MEIKVVFNSKPSNYSREEAVKIAKRNKFTQEGDIYTLIFENPSKDLIKFLRLSERWRVLDIFINGEEANVRKIRSSLLNFENSKDLLSRIYLSEGFHFSLSELKKYIRDAETSEWVSGRIRTELEEIDFVKKIGKNEFLIDKKLVKEKVEQLIKEEYFFLSPYYNQELIDKTIQELPDKFKLLNREEQEEAEEQQEEAREEEFENLNSEDIAKQIVEFIKKEFPEEKDSITIKYNIIPLFWERKGISLNKVSEDIKFKLKKAEILSLKMLKEEEEEDDDTNEDEEEPEEEDDDEEEELKEYEEFERKKMEIRLKLFEEEGVKKGEIMEKLTKEEKKQD